MKKISHYFLFLIVAVALLSSHVALAQTPCGRPTCDDPPKTSPPAKTPTPPSQGNPTTGQTTTPTTPTQTTPAPTSSGAKLINLSKFTSITELVFGIINYALVLIGVISTLMIIYGGFLMVTSGGSEERLSQGKRALMWAIIGFAVALLSFSIVSIVQNILQ